MHLRTSAVAVASTSLALMALTGVASAAQMSGVVVERNPHAHTFVLADHQGRLHEMHSRHSPAVGHSVSVSATQLRNGTWAADHVRVGASHHRVRIRGTVTFVSSRKGVFVVSARGVSLRVHRRAARAQHASNLVAATASLHDQLPSVGNRVTVTTDLGGGEVDATGVSDQGQNANGIDLEGTVLALDASARTLTISADDSDQTAGTLVVDVPSSFDMTLFVVGGRVELIASLNPDGTYTLEQSSDDGSVAQAQNGGDEQGDGEGDHHASAAAVCRAQQADANFAAAHNGAAFDEYYAIDPANLNDAFGHCVDAMASDHGGTSPAAQCFAQRNDPNFAATHSGETFLQYYSTDPAQQNPADAFGHCVDLLHQSSDGPQGGDQSGSRGDQSGSGGDEPGSGGDHSGPGGDD